MKVCLDPGHGETDSGAVANGIVEKVVNLEVAMAVRDELTKRGHQVVMTRTGDSTFATGIGHTADDICDRGAFSVEQGADIFVSIHHDVGDEHSSAEGTSGFYHEGAPNGQDLATQITTRIHERMGFAYAYGTPAQVHWINLGVLRGGDNWLHVTACLVECCFLSNDGDAARIRQDSYAGDVAGCIVDGIEAHAAKEGIITGTPTAEAGIKVIGPSGEVLTKGGREIADQLWVPGREVFEALGYTVNAQHLADQGKIYLTKPA